MAQSSQRHSAISQGMNSGHFKAHDNSVVVPIVYMSHVTLTPTLVAVGETVKIALSGALPYGAIVMIAGVGASAPFTLANSTDGRGWFSAEEVAQSLATFIDVDPNIEATSSAGMLSITPANGLGVYDWVLSINNYPDVSGADMSLALLPQDGWIKPGP